MKTIKNLFKTRKLRFHQNCKKQIENLLGVENGIWIKIITLRLIKKILQIQRLLNKIKFKEIKIIYKNIKNKYLILTKP